jgi:signal transduction histidine kinase
MSRRAGVIAAAIVLFCATLALRELVGKPGDAVLALNAVPVALIAVEFGWRGGLVAASIAFVPVVVSGHLRSLGYLARGLTFLATALVVGVFADRLRAAQAEAVRQGRRAEHLARRSLEAEQAVAGERARIARELHDVIAHSVSVMTVQSAAARRVVDSDRESAVHAMEVVERTGREALGELRRLLGLVRPRDSHDDQLLPQPGVEDLETLVSQMRGAGVEIDLRLEGEPTALAAGVDLSAYRIVQEGLTNVLKHGGRTEVELLVRYSAGFVELVISNELPADALPYPNGGGHGLVGMRERVSMLGGELEAGPVEGGRYRVRARLPTRGRP